MNLEKKRKQIKDLSAEIKKDEEFSKKEIGCLWVLGITIGIGISYIYYSL